MGEDYFGFVTTLTFPAGAGPGALQSAVIAIIDDDLVESDEIINIVATVLPPGQFLDSGGNVSFTSIIIIDNDCK